MFSYIERFHNFYKKYDRPISSISLVGGFVFDAVALKRVDAFWENFWIVVHLGVVGICIILLNVEYNLIESSETKDKYTFWLINVMQFMFGGLFSVFLVFYFRSASLAVSWPFLLALGIAFFLNERFKKHYERLTFQISLFYLSIICFSIFLVPVIVHSIGVGIFLLSELVSLLVLWIFLKALRVFSKEKFLQSRTHLRLWVGSIFILMNVFYFTNLIPPIPLSLKDAGIYRSITRDTMGNYSLVSEDQGFWGFIHSYDTVHLDQGEPVYAYSSIFSPTDLDTRIIHEWQYYDDASKSWITSSRIPLSVSGGREQGFRTYSVKSNLKDGKWRVNVETPRGQLIGRIKFKVIGT